MEELKYFLHVNNLTEKARRESSNNLRNILNGDMFLDHLLLIISDNWKPFIL